MDKTAFSVVSLHDDSDEKAFWSTQTPAARFEALEFLRQVAFNYDPTTTRLQRVLEVAQLAGR